MTYNDRLVVNLLFASSMKESERIKIIRVDTSFCQFHVIGSPKNCPKKVSAQWVTNNTTSDSIDFWGGLSTEPIDISKADKSDLIYW